MPAAAAPTATAGPFALPATSLTVPTNPLPLLLAVDDDDVVRLGELLRLRPFDEDAAPGAA